MLHIYIKENKNEFACTVCSKSLDQFKFIMYKWEMGQARNIYYAKYYGNVGRPGEWPLGKKLKIKSWGKMKEGKERRGKIT